MEPLNIGILGTGSYVPERVQTNAELEASLHLQENWIFSKTGIVERRIAAPYEATSDLATYAALRALADADLEADQLDLLIVATSTPDYPLPATASIVQKNIGASHAAAFDVSAVCSGFVYALVLAQSAMQGNRQFRYTLEKYGNTAAASVPLTLDVANKAGRIPDQATVLLVAFGGGLAWGGVLLRWVAATRMVYPLENTSTLETARAALHMPELLQTSMC